MTQQHSWVKHVITPVSMIPDDEGKPIIFVDPDDQKIAEDNAAYGCDHCGEAMATHHDRPCEAVNDDGEL